MQRRNLLSTYTLLMLLLGLAPAAQAQVQIRIPAEALLDNTAMEQVLRVGDQFEQEGRWGEALGHYENAAKEYPGQVELKQRAIVARAHFDCIRRYSDSSFRASINQLDQRRAMQLYDEVLAKLQSNYVEEPDWNMLTKRGVLQLEAALKEKQFRDRHPNLKNVSVEQVTAELNRFVEARNPRSREATNDLVNTASAWAATQTGLPASAVVLEFLCGATTSLDLYSSYLTGDQLDEVFSQIEGNFVGLGIEIRSLEHALEIVDVIETGPAATAGIRPGDAIIAVDGKSMQDITTDQAADMLKGEPDSYVVVSVRSADESVQQLRIRRERIELPSVEGAKIIDQDFGIAYMRLPSFQKTTTREVDAALWELHRQGMKSLIVDVRGNPGGLLTASVELADKFITEGAIVATRGRSPREDFDYRAHHVGTWRVPLTVLIDGDSASASEIFAGAIRDHRRGMVVGVRSYGKGSVQGIFPLSAYKAGLRLTTAKFFSPSGQAISGQGVSPDVTVRSAAKPLDGSVATSTAENGDTILNAALSIARQQLSQRN
jgi:carboxyl-terminal processing protease